MWFLLLCGLFIAHVAVALVVALNKKEMKPAVGIVLASLLLFVQVSLSLVVLPESYSEKKLKRTSMLQFVHSL